MRCKNPREIIHEKRKNHVDDACGRDEKMGKMMSAREKLRAKAFFFAAMNVCQ